MLIFQRFFGIQGYEVGGGELRKDPGKIEAILNWPRPSNAMK